MLPGNASCQGCSLNVFVILRSAFMSCCTSDKLVCNRWRSEGGRVRRRCARWQKVVPGQARMRCSMGWWMRWVDLTKPSNWPRLRRTFLCRSLPLAAGMLPSHCCAICFSPRVHAHADSKLSENVKGSERALRSCDWSRVILTAMITCRMERWTFWTLVRL